MIDVIQQQLVKFANDTDKFNHLREILQFAILKIIDEKGFFKNISFVGGTALRVLYDLKRFSEDLDFCLVKKENYNFGGMMDELEKALRLENLSATIRYKDHKTVASAFVKFDNLLFDLKLSSHQDKKLNIKFEVDQNPPEGFHEQFTMINKLFLVGINHFDLPSLYAGKLHALLCRKYPKGRDYYDFIWYCGKKMQPNFEFLNNAIEQTEHTFSNLNSEMLAQILKQKFETVDFKKIQADVSVFLEDQRETRFFQKDFFLSLADQIAPN